MNNEMDFKQFEPFIPPVHFELIPIKNLVSNQDYQRTLSEKHVNTTADNFDVCQINAVKVSRRNGTNFVFDGQHTIETIALVSGSRETPVWCMIFDDLEYQREAEIFANQTKYTKALTPYEIFMANIEAGNDKQLIIRSLVESYGLKIANKVAPGNICAVATLESIHDKYSFQILDRTLRLIIGAWEGSPKSFSANMLNGVARLIHCFGDNLKDNLFIEKLGVVSLKELTRTARERSAGSRGFAEAMLLIYNKKTQRPLQMSKLYSNKGPKPQNPLSDEDNSSKTQTPDPVADGQMDLFSDAIDE